MKPSAHAVLMPSLDMRLNDKRPNHDTSAAHRSC